MLVVSGTEIIRAFATESGELWHYDLQQEYGAFGLTWGYASASLLYDGALYVEVLHGMHTDDPSYVMDFDAASGEV